MARRGLAIAVIVLVLVVLAVVIVALYLVTTAEPAQPILPTSPATDENANPANLIDLTGLPCCVVNGATVDRTFIPQYNVVVAPTPTGYTLACEALVATPTEYDVCIALARPTGTATLANPVARRGIKYYYVFNGTQSGCETTATCPLTVGS